MQGLQLNSGDLERAAAFCLQQREQAKSKRGEDKMHRQRAKEQKRYGRTPNGQRVNMETLDRLVDLGMHGVELERPVAAEVREARALFC